MFVFNAFQEDNLSGKNPSLKLPFAHPLFAPLLWSKRDLDNLLATQKCGTKRYLSREQRAQTRGESSGHRMEQTESQINMAKQSVF